MFSISDSIKFMMAKIFFNLANFSYNKYTSPSTPQFHGIDTIVINYVAAGSGKVIIEDETFTMDEKGYFVIPPFKKYYVIPNGSMSIYTIYLLTDKTSGYKKFFPLLDVHHVGKDKFNLDYLFSSLHNEFKVKSFGYNEIVVSLFKMIIVTLLRDEGVDETRESHWDLDSFQYQIENILQNEFNTITLNDLASRLYMSPRELQRYLLENYKKSFINLKTDARMSFASNKLLYSNLPISEISIMVGYSSIEHFSYAFKNHYGISPLKYRKKYQEIK